MRIEANRARLSDFNKSIWNFAEPAWREYKSARAYCELLRAEGFAVEQGSGGMPTAFAATWERGAAWPTLATGSYIDRKEEINPWGSCTDNWLHRPRVVDGKAERQFDAPLVARRFLDAVSDLH